MDGNGRFRCVETLDSGGWNRSIPVVGKNTAVRTRLHLVRRMMAG